MQRCTLTFTVINSSLSYFSESGGVPGGCDLFHSRLTFASGWMLCDVWSLLTTFNSCPVCIASTCGRYWQPFCSKVTACVGTWPSSGAPAEMYTTTFANALFAPATTVSVVIGVACCLAHDGSFDMSMGFGLAGVPVKFTLPLTVPAISRQGHSNNVRMAGRIFLVRIAYILPCITISFQFSMSASMAAGVLLHDRVRRRHVFRFVFRSLQRRRPAGRFQNIVFLAAPARLQGTQGVHQIPRIVS